MADHLGPQLHAKECELSKRSSIMADTVTTEASGTTEAEENAQGITTLEELTASFVEKVEEAETPQSDEAKESETPNADASDEQDEDVLSQLTETEESEEEEEKEAEEEESTDESGDAEPPKAVGKLLKQINKLTARAKGAEETAESLQAQIESLKTTPQSSSQAKQPALEEVQDFQSLETLRKEALAAKRWSLQHIGKDYVEVDGKEYADEDIRNILTQAEDYLSEKIPERAHYLQASQQWQQDTINAHPWISETVDTDQAEERRSVLGQIKSQYADILKSIPNGDFVAATLVRGVEAIKSDHAAKTAKPKAKRVAKAPPPTMGDSSPPVQTSATRKTANQQKILGKQILSGSDLAALFAE